MPDNSKTSDLAAPAEGLIDGDVWLTTNQVAEEFGYHRETIRRWIRDGGLKARRDPGGRTLWVRRSDVQLALEQGARRQGSSESSIAVPGDRTSLVR